MNIMSLVITIVVCITIFAMIETGWTVIQRPTLAVDRFKRASERFGIGRAYLFAAILGYIGFVYCGFYGLLFWMPPEWGVVGEDGKFSALRMIVAGLLTLAALSSISLLERYPQLVSDIPMWKQTICGVEQMIDRAHDLTSVVESFKVRPSNAPEHLREADLLWLLARAETLQKKVAAMLENASTVKQQSKEKTPPAERPTMENEPRGAVNKDEIEEQRWRTFAQRNRTLAALDAVLPNATAPVVDALPMTDTSGWVQIATEAVKARWAKLDKIFTAIEVPNGCEGDESRSTDISFSLHDAPGLELPGGLKVVGHYHGNAHGGETKIVATLDGKLVDLAQAAQYAMTLDGICTAFFLAHLAPTYGRYWHGLYDYDYSMLLDRAALMTWAVQSDIQAEPGGPLESLSRGPGLWVSSAKSILSVAALGAGKTTNLTDFSIELADGRLIKTARRLLVPSNITVLY